MRRVPGAGVKKEIKRDPTKVHVFIDDSNIFIEGQRTAKKRDPGVASVSARFRIDYGKLLEWILEGRTLGSVYLVGSRPPEVDSFWNSLKSKGIKPTIFDRQAGREKGVDHDLVAEMIETSILKKEEDSVMVLIAGDGDYRSTLDRLNKKSWTLEVYFWRSGCSPLIRNTPWYSELDPHFVDFCFFEKDRFGP